MQNISDTKQIKSFLAVSTFIVVACVLAGCGEKPAPLTPTPKTETTKLFEQERAVLEKAKGVEQGFSKNAEQLKQDVEQQAQ